MSEEIVGTFDDWRRNKEKLECVALYLDHEFILSIQSCIKVCERRMMTLDQDAYDKYVIEKAKYLETQTKLAFGGK